MKNKFIRSTLLISASSLLAAFSANAANTFYNAGDLLMTFQKVGNGANTVYVNLGQASAYRGSASGVTGAVNNYNFLDLNSTLNTAFSPSTPGGWKSDTSIYVGLASYSFVNSTSTGLVSGDPRNTLYVSSARNTVGTVGSANSTALAVGTNTDMSTAAGGIQAQNNIYADVNNTLGYVGQTIISPVVDSGIDNANPFFFVQGNPVPFQDTAYGVFSGGVQQAGTTGTIGNYGAGEVEFALDLNRILARGTGGTGTSAPVGGQVSGPVRTGTFEGTFTLGTNGMVSFVGIPEPSSIALTGLAAFGLVLRRRRSA